MNAENSPKMQRIWPCGNDLEDHRPAPYIFRKLFREQHLHSRWYTSALNCLQLIKDLTLTVLKIGPKLQQIWHYGGRR